MSTMTHQESLQEALSLLQVEDRAEVEIEILNNSSLRKMLVEPC